MGCCCTCFDNPQDQKDPEADQTFQRGGDNDIYKGPIKSEDRKCTDGWCTIVLVVFVIGYLVVTLAGANDGNPVKLYHPRDWKGDYCGVEDNWNGGANLKDAGHLSYSMNVHNTIEDIALELVCSSAADSELERVFTAQEYKDYLCACCKTPCDTCDESLDQTDYSSINDLTLMLSDKLGELTNPDQVTSLYSTGGANGDFFISVWESVTHYFHAVCTKSCASVTTGLTRTYDYAPPLDASWKLAWDTLQTDPAIDPNIHESMLMNFTFKAMSSDECPYEPKYCVPFPGVSFSDLMSGYCLFGVSNDVLYSVGATTADSLQDYATSDLASEATEDVAGALYETIEATIVTMLASFVLGMAFITLLRFFVGKLVWCSILGVFVLFVLGGGAAYARSEQCVGDTIFDSGSGLADNAVTLASTAVESTVTGETSGSEEISGDGADYRGAQTQTVEGFKCQHWDSQSPWTHTMTPANHPGAGLDENYCRNPNNYSTIWCYTTDTLVDWQMCTPISIYQVECPNGYYVESDSARDAFKGLGYVLWGIAVLWFALVCCMYKRIWLAIEVNKVATMFITFHPCTVLVPVVQILAGLIWTLTWSLSVAFLVSQVPEGHTPTDTYSTHDAAVEACESQAYHGFIYEIELNTTDCFGTCYRCTQPRALPDARAWFSLFVYLWLMWLWVAIGQFIIASAVAIWLFTPNDKKKKVHVLRDSLHRAWRYHLGSLALGSFLIACVTFFRVVLKHVEAQTKGTENRAVKMMLKVIQCFMWCFEKCLKFLNKNAYIQIALTGKDFCTSAKKAFYLILRNFLRFGSVAFLGGVIHRLGFIFITTATALSGYGILNLMYPEASPLLPIFLYIFIGYTVSVLFMNVFSLAVDTSLMCFICVEEMGESANIIPGPLCRLVGRSKKAWPR